MSPTTYIFCIFHGDLYDGKGVIHGLYKKLHTNGKLECLCDYEYGAKRGVEKFWHFSGKLSSETPYVNGLKHGEQKVYDYEKETIMFSTMWKEGKKHGPETHLGERRKFMMWKNGQEDGLWTEYHSNGVVGSITTYDHGKRTGIQISNRRDGTLLAETPYVDDNLHGIRVEYAPDRTVSGRFLYERGEYVRKL